MTLQHSNSRSGFTLIELSIVLVIIGLIVGGILVGQDMIRAAEIRATVAQVEKYNTATNTFRSKYGFAPGDIPSTRATEFGIFAITGGSANATGFGDGNGLLEGAAATSATARGENLIYWRHLSDAELVDGRFGASGDSVIVAGTGLLTGNLSSGTANGSFPPAKIGRGNFITAFSATGQNFYQILGITLVTAATGVYTTVSSNLSPIEAQNIDAKVDDGFATTGAIRAAGGTAGLNGTADTACVSGTAYDVGTTNGTTPNCQLRLRFN